MTMLLMPEKPCFMLVSVTALITGFYLISSFIPGTENMMNLVCPLGSSEQSSSSSISDMPLSPSSIISAEISKTILHYATNPVVPQQSKAEISISLAVLLRRRPCNFLVFGLGNDSPMWAAFNPTGYTLFLEEDLSWYNKVMKDTPFLNAKYVKYSTKLRQADNLLANYRKEPKCLPKEGYVKDNRNCKLALWNMPEEVYRREWDLIMVDAPKGYFAEAPGRMAAIWTAAIMARGRKKNGDTDVFLHDVNRRVEKGFANEFLCEKYKVNGVGRLWHFQIPKNGTTSDNSFC